MPKKARINEIELLRGLAFLAVALQHAIAHYGGLKEARMEDGVLMTILLLAAKFAVPVFIFITGMVLFYNYDGQLRFGSFLRKRFSDILVPYILWSAVYFTVGTGWGGDVGQRAGTWAANLVTGKNSYHLWYIVMIFQFYLLFPVLRLLMRECAKRVPFKWRAAALAGAGLLCLLLVYNLFRISGMMADADIPFLTPFFTAYADRNFLYFAFYFILGAAAGMAPERWTYWLNRGKAAYLAVFAVLFGYYTYVTVRSFSSPDGLHISFNGLSLLRPLMTLFLICSIFVFYAWSKTWTEAAGPISRKVMNGLGRYSYGAYLAHALMLRQSYKVDAWVFAGWNVTLRMLMSFLICAVLSYGVTIALSYLPFGKWTAGISSLPGKKRMSVPAQAQQTVRHFDGN
ncbi:MULTISPECIES: acyltransferase [Paenibacillus]|uniref:Membrane protein n=1 Tax=Paenibacillus albilobatus TaxID=2716884 RepID=A0A920CA92_9BACL|nr:MULTISPECIES: acyltransferase [Paenibacillus]GIO29859.1 membrane protein [Paenibacillus albilobatus]